MEKYNLIPQTRAMVLFIIALNLSLVLAVSGTATVPAAGDGYEITNTLLTVLDENGNGVPGATFQIACGGGWLSPNPPGVTDVNGQLIVDVPACMTKMLAKVGNSSKELTLAELISSGYTWTTEILRVNLKDHTGTPITDQTGSLEQGGGAWISLGNFNASGYVDVPTFPTNSGRYKATYNCTSETKNGIVVTAGPGIQELDFLTGQIISTCGHTQYQGCGWSAFTSGMEQMPGTRTFRYPVESATVVAGEILTLSCCTPPTFTDCPATISANTGAGVCTAVVDYTVATSGSPAPSFTYAFTGVTPGSGSGTGSGSTFEKGETTVTVTASNGCTPDAVCTITVTVSDNEAPVITLLGDATVEICQGTPYADAGANASDNCDGDISANIAVFIPSGLSSEIPGTYTVTYDVTDAASNPAPQVTRNVTVKPAPVGVSQIVEVCSGTTLNIDLQSLISNSVPSSFIWEAEANMEVNGEETGTQNTSVIHNQLDLVVPANGNQTVVYTVNPTGTNGCPGQPFTITVEVFACEVTISDPCVCKDNATTQTNGQFDETVTVTGPSGDTWTVVVAPGLYQTSSPAPPAAPVPISTGTPLVEGPAGTYILNGIHVDAQGYAISLTNGFVTLSQSNTCYYPNPSISGLSELYCNQDGPQMATVTAELGDGTGTATIGNIDFQLIRQSDNLLVLSQSGTSVSFNFSPFSLDSGFYTLLVEFDAGNDGSIHPGCIQPIEASFEVRTVGCGTFPWDGQ